MKTDCIPTRLNLMKLNATRLRRIAHYAVKCVATRHDTCLERNQGWILCKTEHVRSVWSDLIGVPRRPHFTTNPTIVVCTTTRMNDYRFHDWQQYKSTTRAFDHGGGRRVPAWPTIRRRRALSHTSVGVLPICLFLRFSSLPPHPSLRRATHRAALPSH